MVIARQSTARTVIVGPVLDADGVAVTDGVVGDFKISKNGGAPAALNGSATLTHRHTGMYSLALTASDLDTVGQAEVTLDDSTNACPVKEITIIEEAVYDISFASSATGAVPVASIANGAITAAAIATGAIDADAIADNAIDAGAIASDAITAAKIATGAITSAKFAAGAITAAAIATDAIDADALAADAIAEINATVDTALADYDGPTNAEMEARTLAAASYATAAAQATAQADLDTLTGTDGVTLATSQPNYAPATAAAATAIEADTQDIQSRLPDALVSGSIKANITHVIGDAVQENGATDTNWGAAP